jgi:hypothetical protein
VATTMAAVSLGVGEMAWVPILEEGVFRFDASEDARVAAGPSLSFADPRRREVRRDGGDRPSVLPACEVVAGNVQKVVIKVRVRAWLAQDALVFLCQFSVGGGFFLFSGLSLVDGEIVLPLICKSNKSNFGHMLNLI